MRKTLNYFLFAVIFAGFFGSCITPRRLNYMQSRVNNDSLFNDTVVYKDYKLKVGDYLYFTVYSTDDNATEILNGVPSGTTRNTSDIGSSPSADLITYLIDQNGDIDFPMAGKMHVAGLTLRETGYLLEEKLSSVLEKVSVDARIVRRYFSVIGEGKTGRYSIEKEKLTIYEALAMIGDVGDFTDRGHIKLMREVNNKLIIKEFDLRSTDIINSEFYYIEPNDILYLPTLKEQFLGITSLASLISIVLSTYSFGFWIYKLANPK